MITATTSYHDRASEVLRSVRARAERAIVAGAQYIARRVRENISTPGPPASAPGEYPHVDTGELLASIEVRGTGMQRTVVATADHAEQVEQSREFMQRTYRENRKRLREIVFGELRKG